ncbi:MetQ/NlpA family ABC transporter substrate-binding protein [Legionella clemsonensis]|uniref:D-methionine-binding lipoprotein MetQ n=1 Tax=Legionella clemsonensis TaxID=1867846 RepID=A0A222P4I7_9GAMM|nr:MetQ/NlpA family ABC transporter substrate-binding protein [Legionella clemsonensis]ASQ46756.1 D-methionine-binding lipoprotein MetQ precursor [Legionella clemsonensis]
MRILSLFLLVVSLVACNKPSPNTLNIGTIAGPETELVEVAKDVAMKDYGLEVKIVEFNDYNLPNEALDDGSLDANVYQHLPYLQAAMKAHGYNLEVIGKTFIYPAGLYSNKVKSLKQLRDRAIIAIPNDPSNEARALLLLQKAGLITLKNSNTATTADIATNPKHFVIKELDAAQLPRVLNDVDAAVINTTFAIPAGLSPARDAIYKEGKDSPYANLIVIRQNSIKKPQLEKFVKAMNSPAVAAKAKELFGDGAIPAW